MYYAFIQNNLINGVGQCRCLNNDIINAEISETIFNEISEDKDRYIWDISNQEVVANPDYEEIVKRRERERLDNLTLTPADVERALYKAKDMDFDDLKDYIHSQLPDLDIKALSIEFRAKDFYRGAEANGIRLFDVVGKLLGYLPEDMDYLFEHKELPTGGE